MSSVSIPVSSSLSFVCADWSKIGKECYTIREQVFVQEQKVPVEDELDEYDPKCLHFLISASPTTQDDENAVNSVQHAATGRLVILPDNETGKIGRMAVLKEFRGSGVGKFLLKAIVDHAKNNIGLKKLTLGAQQHATKFYEKEGFVIHGDVFMDAGIPHLEMRREF